MSCYQSLMISQMLKSGYVISITVIISLHPLTYYRHLKFKGKLDPKSEKYVEVQIDTSFSELCVCWNERQFHMMVELYANLQECFDRDVPLNDDLLSASALFKKRLKGLKSIEYVVSYCIGQY